MSKVKKTSVHTHTQLHTFARKHTENTRKRREIDREGLREKKGERERGER